MKPLEKYAPSSRIQSTATINELFDNLRKKKKVKDGLPSSSGNQQEILCILTDDIPADELAKILQTKKGLTVKLKDDLLKRLIKLEKENNHLKSLTITDELTGLLNKRFFNKQLKIEITRTKRTGQPFCLMFIDLDNFKSVNDTFGHTRGDEFLIKLCRLINQKIRPTDFACRYGGDEFTIIMPTTFLFDGISIAQRWRALIESVAEKMKVDVSASIGIDEFSVFSLLSAENFIDRVDKQLYEAKSAGKNRVSYPGYPQARDTEARSVSPAEKEALYKAFTTSTPRRKPLRAKG